MPSDTYTTVMMSNKISAKLSELVVTHDLEVIAEVIYFIADAGRDPETLSEVDLPRPLYLKFED